MKLDIRTTDCLYIKMDEWTFYIDNSTNEQIMEKWKGDTGYKSKDEIVDKVINNIYDEHKMTFEELCDNYDNNMIFYDEIMKYQDISALGDGFEIMNACMDAYRKKYPEPLVYNAVQVALDHLEEFLEESIADADGDDEYIKECKVKLEATRSAQKKFSQSPKGKG